MKFRLSEGNGECYYCLGVADDGYPRGLPAEELEESIEGVFKMAELLHAKAEIKWRFHGGFGQECVVIKITRSLNDQLDIIDLRLGGHSDRFCIYFEFFVFSYWSNGCW